uniref:AB hydrolase-1 domain-containing protein n=1 Tax=Bionectria ochroleuca TaxID=29856 RepID=A0A0B7JV95_BIOOC
MAAPTKVQFKAGQLTIAAELHAPAEGSPNRKGAAVVVSHPMTGVKEQTSSDYARSLSKAGFYALTFDAGYQGESSGEPRGLEDPSQRVEDIKSAVSYLVSLTDKINPERIGVLGICASGGYVSAAAQSDIRIRAVATVSGACVGALTRNGAAAQWRNAEATSGVVSDAPVMFDSDPSKWTEDSDAFFRGASQYYGTPRGKHPRSTQKVPPQSSDKMITYDSFRFQYLISPRPLLMIAGSEAESLHFSQTAVAQAKEPKELLVIPGKNHFDLYDDLAVSGPKLSEFFGKYLE